MRNQAGMTLVELATVLAVLAVLLMIAVPNFATQRKVAKLAKMREHHGSAVVETIFVASDRHTRLVRLAGDRTTLYECPLTVSRGDTVRIADLGTAFRTEPR